MDKKENVPVKGASRKWAARLKELAQQPLPKSILDQINDRKEKKKSADSKTSKTEVDL